MAGQYTIGLAITTPVMIFFGSNLRAIIVSDVRRECPMGSYMAFRLLSVANAMCMIFVIVLMAGYQYETALIIMMVGVAKSIEGISAIFFGYFHQNERMDQIAVSRIAKGILSVLFFVAGMWASGSVLGGVVGLAAAWLTTLLLFDIPRAVLLAKHRVAFQNAPMERFWPVWDAWQLKKLFMLSLPIGITVMLISLNVNIPRYFVEAWQGVAILGIFGPMSYFMVLGNEVALALGRSATPRMARYYVHGDRAAVIHLLLRQKAVGACFGLFGVVLAATAGSWILSVIFGPEYAQYGRVFLLLMMASGVRLVFGFSSMFLTAARAFWIQIPVRACSVATMVLCCVLLVPSHGISGAAAAMLISTLVHAVLALSATIFILYRMQAPDKSMELPRTAVGQIAAIDAPGVLPEKILAESPNGLSVIQHNLP